MSIKLGPVIYTAVKPIFKIYFIIACGYFLGRRNILTVETSRNISDIIISLILPSLIFSKIVTNLQNSDIKQIGIICLVYALFTIIGGIAGLACYAVGKPQYWLGGCLSVALMPNISDLPIAYLQTFANGLVFTEEQGEKGVAYICIFTAVQVLIQFNLGLFKLIGYDFDVQRKAEAEQRKKNFDEDHSDSLTQSTPEDKDDHVSGLDDDVEAQRSYASNNVGEEEEDHVEEEEEDDDDEDNSSIRYNDRIIPLTDLRAGIGRSQSHVSTLSLRRSRSQNVNELVREYSQAASVREGMHAVPATLTDLEMVPTNKPVSTQEKKSIVQHAKSIFYFTLDNFKRPISIALVISIAVAMIPWVKALFVKSTQATLPAAPDNLPPLSFVMDFCGYLANACVPLGLLILGATLSRLQVSRLNFRVMLTPIMLSFLRLILLPIIGCAVIAGFAKLGWFEDDDILRFTCTITWGLPNATSLIYLTAFYTPLDGEWKQMDTLALTYIVQYPILSISLPFLTTYVIKDGLNY